MNSSLTIHSISHSKIIIIIIIIIIILIILIVVKINLGSDTTLSRLSFGQPKLGP